MKSNQPKIVPPKPDVYQLAGAARATQQKEPYRVYKVQNHTCDSCIIILEDKQPCFISDVVCRLVHSSIHR